MQTSLPSIKNLRLAASLAGFRFCVKALLGSRSLSLTATWEGMSAEQIAEANGHRTVVCLIRVSHLD